MNCISKKTFAAIFLFSSLAVFLFSCSKEPGTGGNSSIFGKVLVKDYNATFTILNEEYYAQDIEVYLIYGDDKSYSEHVKTAYDGTYEFKYLRPGNYHVYCYSEDSTLQTLALIPIIRDVTLSKNKETVEVPQIVIFK